MRLPNSLIVVICFKMPQVELCDSILVGFFIVNVLFLLCICCSYMCVYHAYTSCIAYATKLLFTACLYVALIFSLIVDSLSCVVLEVEYG